MKNLAIVASHPIQYNAPWFRLLTERGIIKPKVFYTWYQSSGGSKYDPDFGKVISWDIPLLDGYDYEFVVNVASQPGSHHFRGIDNPGLNKAIAAYSPDAILVIGWAYKSHLACIRYFKGKVPVFFRGDSTLLDETNGIKTILRRIFLTWVYRHIDKVLYVGTNNKNYFAKHGIKEERLYQALHAIDNDRFSNPTTALKEEGELREKLGIRPGDFVVLFTGKLEAKKNPFFLIELSQRIKDPEIIFLFVGNGHLESELKSRAAYDPRIKFLSFQNQSQMPAVYNAANIFILPSAGPGETWGLAANEAMASGLPVILSSKAGGAVDLVKGNGIIFHRGEIARVQAYIENLKQNPAQYTKAREASLSHIQNFNFVQIAEAIEKACGV